MGTYAPVNASRLKQTIDTFYERMNSKEADVVKAMVDDIDNYMRRLGKGPFLIAGVGGVLRFEDPGIAKDIDLAVVGLKYTNNPGRDRTHSFDDVIHFTKCVQGYFSNLVARLREGREEYSPLHESGATFSTGSGPFKGLNDRFGGRKDDSSIEVRSYLENFGWYNSKGLQVIHSGSKPVDVQFIFNQTPNEWEKEQEILQDSPLTRNGKADKFFYAVLLEYLGTFISPNFR